MIVLAPPIACVDTTTVVRLKTGRFSGERTATRSVAVIRTPARQIVRSWRTRVDATQRPSGDTCGKKNVPSPRERRRGVPPSAAASSTP